MKKATIKILYDNGTTQNIETMVYSKKDLQSLADSITSVYGSSSTAGFMQLPNYPNYTTTFIDLRKTVSVEIQFEDLFEEE